MSAFEQVTMLHTSCLQNDPRLAPVGRGDIAAILVTPITIEGPPGAGTIRLNPGDVLLGRHHVFDIRDAISVHAGGQVLDSRLRLGVSLVLGLPPNPGAGGPLAATARADIDHWLGRHTAFAFWPGETADSAAEGFFDGVARSWAARNQTQATARP